MKLTVYFNDAFWIGLVECDIDAYQCASFIFGSEPSNQEVLDMLMRTWHVLRFTSPHESDEKRVKEDMNPKRKLRLAKKEMKEHPARISKAHQAMKQEQEKRKLVKKQYHKEEKEAQSTRKYQLKKAKQKAKHRGH